MSPTNESTTLPDGGRDAGSRDDARDDDPLTTLFGNHAKVRLIIELFDSNEPKSVPKLVDDAGLDSRTSWYRQKDDLLASGIVEEVEKVGNSPRYELADDGNAIQALEQLRDFVNSNRLEDRKADSE